MASKCIPLCYLSCNMRNITSDYDKKVKSTIYLRLDYLCLLFLRRQHQSNAMSHVI